MRHHSIIAATALTLLAGAPAHSQTYTVIEIPTLGGPSSSALALNNRGVVVGISNTSAAPSISRAFRWEAGAIIDLGTLGGPSAEAFDVNDAGQITGRAETKDSIQFNETFHAFRWESGVMIDLGTTGGQSSRGWTINAQGMVAGASQICWIDPKNPKAPCFPVGNEYAFVWDGKEAVDLGGLLGSSDSCVLGMNATVQMVGQSIVVSGAQQPRHATLWQNGQIFDLGTLGGFNSWAFDINEAGIATGFSDTAANDAHHPFLYDTRTGQMTDLGLPPGFVTAEAIAINAAGHVVGLAGHCCGWGAFLYDGVAMHDLNEMIPAGSGWELLEADDINDAGWIVGHGLHNGLERGFLLKPAVVIGDLTGDGVVGPADLAQLLATWGKCPTQGNCPADLNHDDIVGPADLAQLLAHWG